MRVKRPRCAPGSFRAPLEVADGKLRKASSTFCRLISDHIRDQIEQFKRQRHKISGSTPSSDTLGQIVDRPSGHSEDVLAIGRTKVVILNVMSVEQVLEFSPRYGNRMHLRGCRVQLCVAPNLWNGLGHDFNVRVSAGDDGEQTKSGLHKARTCALRHTLESQQ